MSESEDGEIILGLGKEEKQLGSPGMVEGVGREPLRVEALGRRMTGQAGGDSMAPLPGDSDSCW